MCIFYSRDHSYCANNLTLTKDLFSFSPRDADDAVQDMDGKDLQGGRVRVELARDPRDRRDRDRDRGRSFGGGRDGRRRGNPPGPKTNYRVVVENISSRTSWQVRSYLLCTIERMKRTLSSL